MRGPEGWTVQPLGDFLHESRIPGNDGRSARKLTVRLYGKGVVAREAGGQGSENTKYYLRKKGQFVYSKLDFLNGAFGVVPEELDGWETTLDLPAFDVSPAIDTRWLLAYVTREQFYAAHKGLARGGRKARRVPPEELLQINVAVPPLREQHRMAEILSSVDEAIEVTRAVIEQTRKVRQGVLDRLLSKGISHNRHKQTEIGNIPEHWHCLRVSDVIAMMDSGWSPDCDVERAADGEWGILRTSSVVWEGYKPFENKRLPNSLVPRPEIEVKAGDVLVTRAGPADRTGVVAFVDHTPPNLMLSDKIIRIQSRSDICHPEFLSLALSSSRSQAELVKKKSGMAMSQTNISQKVLRDLYIPVPPISDQILIADEIRSMSEVVFCSAERAVLLNQTKSGLTADLLTGRKRVSADALSPAL
ncbi:MAG: restriction endonuclease subunit S [Alphaproteobacteria bacterium]